MAKKPRKKDAVPTDDWRNWALSEIRGSATRWPMTKREGEPTPSPMPPETSAPAVEDLFPVPGAARPMPAARLTLRGIRDVRVQFRLALPEETQTPTTGEGEVTDLSTTGVKLQTADLRRADYNRIIRGVREIHVLIHHRRLDIPLELTGRIVSVDYGLAIAGKPTQCVMGIWFGRVGDALAREIAEFIFRLKRDGTATDGEDRRFHKRLPLAVEAMVTFRARSASEPERVVRAISLETSFSGVRIKTYQLTEKDLPPLLRRPATAEIQLFLPYFTDPLAIEASVVWGKFVERTTADEAHVIIGFQFSSLAEALAERMLNVIRSLEKEAHRIAGVAVRPKKDKDTTKQRRTETRSRKKKTS